jgi:glycosyltransferase involved in cell wall biosynthesis
MMKTILMTAYAINPNKGSEDGMGWNFVIHAAANSRVVAYTRKNNRSGIESFQAANPDHRYSNITFRYFDWPKWLIFWKKGPLLSLIYYYFWQFSLAIKINWSEVKCDVVHNLNFHNDWTPSFLWITGKPFVWGPVGHHPKIDRKHLKFYGVKVLISDRLIWIMKNIFWNLDPFLWMTKKSASQILCMNEDAAQALRLRKEQYTICPSVATDDIIVERNETENFTVISAGRFVPLKGFDITLRAFAAFYHSLSMEQKEKVRLNLVGSGPSLNELKQLSIRLKIEEAVVWTDWIERNELQKLFASSSAFLFPSYEGAGMVVAEAMMHALPVICWDNSGPGEFVPHETQLTVSLKLGVDEAVKSFAAKLELLFNDKGVLQGESAMARARFVNAFSWGSRGQILDKTYRALLNDGTEQGQLSFKVEVI